VHTPSVIHTQLSDSKLTRLTNTTSKDRFIRDTDLRGFGLRISPRNASFALRVSDRATTG
jgi:hypothetical protein